jgi:hypothetical protein
MAPRNESARELHFTSGAAPDDEHGAIEPNLGDALAQDGHQTSLDAQSALACTRLGRSLFRLLGAHFRLHL